MITPQDVADWLKLQGAPDTIVTRCTAAVVAFVNELPTAPRQDDGETWTGQTDLAATMLAARLVRRRNSPSGVEALTETGASYVSRYDPDVARMLRIDQFVPPQIG